MAGKRPENIVHYSEIEKPDGDNHYSGDDELMSNGASYARRFGFKRLGIHHERLQPGRRTSYPHAESLEEEFVYVIEGTPDVWLDGVLHRLAPGEAVGFPPGTGECHTFINNTESEVRLLVVGDRHDPAMGNRIYYARNPERQARLGKDWWSDKPERPMGDHDGLPDKVRERRAREASSKS
jgi:uncharacterized cupin superfamily protein